jgi:hypothetical protein
MKRGGSVAILAFIVVALCVIALIFQVGGRERMDSGEMSKCISASDLNCLKRLYSRDQDLDAHLDKEWTPLTLATSKGKLDVVTWLVENGAKVNEPVAGTTATFWAAFAGRKDIVQFLLSKGADACWVAGDKYPTPKRIAEQKGFNDVAGILPNCAQK